MPAAGHPAESPKSYKVLWKYLDIPVLDLPQEKLRKHGEQYNWAYVLEDKPWEHAPKPGDVWPEGDDGPDICPKEYDIVRRIHEGTLDQCTPQQGLLDYASGCAGYRDHNGNIRYKGGTGAYAYPRLYAVQYHRKEMAYLRPGACYYENVTNEAGKWVKQYYVGYRRGADGTLVYAQAQWWNGCSNPIEIMTNCFHAGIKVTARVLRLSLR